jgi:1,2-diacylglycerol 3-alpha-glucosyltransferase
MRIAHFCDSRPGRIDGVSTSAVLSVSLLRNAGHDVRFFHPAPAPPLKRVARDGDDHVPTVPIPFRDLRLAKPWLRIDPGKADLIHAHTTGPIGMAGFRLARARRIPLVITWHTDLVAYGDHFFEVPIGAAYCARRLGLGWTVRETLELAGRRRRTRLLDLGRGMMSYASMVLAPSAKTAAALAEFGELPPVRVLRTPVILPDDGRTRADVRACLGIAPGTPLVLSVGRMTGEKNPELLIRAFGAVRRHVPRARLVVLGARQGTRAVRALIRELSLDDRVTLLPPVARHRVAGFYRAADVLAFASGTDTQSLVLAEAESQGLPVVLTDRALAADTPWRMCAGPEPESFAAAIARMLTDETQRQRARRCGLDAHAAYSADDHVAALTEAYEACLTH